MISNIPRTALLRDWTNWFAVVQASMNVAAALGACAGPLIIGALTRSDSHTGWRNFYVRSILLLDLSVD
jgi:hypothetical protein